MLNVLWRFLLSVIFILANVSILILVWRIPEFLGLTIPDEMRNLILTFLTFVSLVTGIWGTWTRSQVKKEIKPIPIKIEPGSVEKIEETSSHT
jgi:type VI protein secretion system component VasK